MKAKRKFPKRVVLGEGFPWAFGAHDYINVGLVKDQRGVSPIILDWPKVLWRVEVPRYRLVLERVDER